MAYSIEAAAHATSLTAHAIRLAIKERRLVARDLDGKCLILHSDIQAWLESLPTI